MPEVPVTAPIEPIVAKASRDYRWRRYLLVIVIFGYGLYSLYDGFVRYPKANEAARQQGLEILPYPGYDVPFNRVFGIALPPLSLIFLAWVLYSSRGRYEFDGTTISTPASGPVPVKAIRRIERAKWDRKGIAYLHYQVPGSAKLGVIKLDDFIYERPPTDEIFRLISLAVEGNKAVAVNTTLQRIVCKACGVQNSASATACSACGAPLDVKNLISQS